MTFGFFIRELRITGPEQPDAVLSMKPGLNVIVGPSDTGKTYVGELINFMFGGEVPPKPVPQASGYVSAEIHLEARDSGYRCRLQRSLEGGDIRRNDDEGERILGWKHQGDRTDTVSSFLLGLTGLVEKRVRMDKQGKTRPLSFRDLTRLIIVDEESVITTESPVVTGQHTSATVEARVFRLLLTGDDDASIVARPDRKAQKSRQEGMAQVLEELLLQARQQYSSMGIDSTPDDLRDQLARLGDSVAFATAALAAEQTNAAGLEERRRGAWIVLREIESRENVLAELQSRFALLRSHYQSDLRRLEAIAEAGARLGEMGEDRCPICGSLSQYHDRDHQHEGFDATSVASASRAEAEKTETLLSDLASTLSDTSTSVGELRSRRRAQEVELAASSAELSTVYQPRIQSALASLKEVQERRDAVTRALDLSNRIAELERMHAEAIAPPKRQPISFVNTKANVGEAEPFCKEVEGLLRAWHFPHLDRVTFSEDNQDIVISGRPRGTHGKGVRAITHAAFNLGLLRLCVRNKRPFPGLVLIDSPLVVYREPDAVDGGIPLDVKDAFYRELSSDFADSQVIILENEAPPFDVERAANVIAFSGNEAGRRGLFP